MKIFLTPWLKFILNFLTIEKIDIICADQMALDYKKSIRDAEKQIENIFKDQIFFLDVLIFLEYYVIYITSL